MNGKGQVVLYALMIGMCIFVLGLALIFPVKQATDNARDTAANGGMDCSNSSISSYTKAACLVSDATQPYFIATVLALGGAVVGARLLFGE
jgi:predicted permease